MPATQLQGNLMDAQTHCPLSCPACSRGQLKSDRVPLMMGDRAFVGQCARKLGALRGLEWAYMGLGIAGG